MSETFDVDNAKAFLKLLGDLISRHRLVQATQLFDTVREILPRNGELLAWEGYVQWRLGRDERAVELAIEALGAAPNQPVALFTLDVALARQRARLEAAEALARAQSLAQATAETACTLLEATAGALGIDAAAAVYEEIALHSTDPGLTTCWAKLAFAAGRTEALPPGFGAATISSVRDWLAQQGLSPAFLDEPERFHFEPPPIFGEPDLQRESIIAEGYEPYACTIPDATILSGSSVIYAPDGTALNDMAADPRYGRHMSLHFDGTVVARDGDRLLFDLNGHQLMELDRAMMLSGWASVHFGHWAPEYLCRLAYLERHPQFVGTPIVVDAGMPSQHLEYLRLLTSNPIVELPPAHALRCRELLVGSPSTFSPVAMLPGVELPPEHQGGLPLSGLRLLQQRIRQALPPTGERGRKLYLSRRQCTWRRLSNDEEVGQALADRGFEILYPEDMSFEDQVRMFQSAEAVVAPLGSSLLNAIFAPTDMKLVVLSQRGMFNFGLYYGMMRDLGYALTFVCGESHPEKHADFSIPLPDLLAALEA